MRGDRVLAVVTAAAVGAVLVLLVLVLEAEREVLRRVAPSDGWRGATTERLETLEERLERIERALTPGAPADGRRAPR